MLSKKNEPLHVQLKCRSFLASRKKKLDRKSNKETSGVDVQVLGCLLEAGYDVLLSDSDAVWLKDPMEDMKLHGFDR